MIKEDSSAEKLKSSRGGSSSCFTNLSKTGEFPGLPQRQNDAMIKEKKKTLSGLHQTQGHVHVQAQAHQKTSQAHRRTSTCSTDEAELSKVLFHRSCPSVLLLPLLNSLDLNTVLNCSRNQDILPLTAVASNINSVLQKYMYVWIPAFVCMQMSFSSALSLCVRVHICMKCVCMCTCVCLCVCRLEVDFR